MPVEIDPEEIAPPTTKQCSAAEAKTVDYQSVISTLETLHKNGVESRDRLVTVGERITNLVLKYGLTEGVAAKRAVDELFGGAYADKGELLGVSDSAVHKASRQAFSGGPQTLFNFHRLAGPTNVVFNEVVPTGHGETRFVLVKVLESEVDTELSPNSGDSAEPRAGEQSSNPPKYGLVELQMFNSSPASPDTDDPSERSHQFGVGNLTVSWFFSDEEVVEYLYTGRTLSSHWPSPVLGR